jgi:hypothetical protein
MGASPMPDPNNPQAGAPPAGGPSSGSSQANPLQESLGKLVMLCRQLGAQNTIIQPEMQQCSQTLVQALQKVSQAGSGPAQPLAAPPQA